MRKEFASKVSKVFPFRVDPRYDRTASSESVSTPLEEFFNTVENTNWYCRKYQLVLLECKVPVKHATCYSGMQ